MKIGIGIGIPIGSSYELQPPPILNDGNTELWINAENAIESGGLVSQLTDISGKNNHLTQSNELYKPILSNGEIVFDGLDDYMQVAFTTIPQPFEVFIVVKQNTWADSDIIIGSQTATPLFLYNQRISTGNTRLHAGASVDNSSLSSVGVYNIHRLVLNAASSSSQIDENIKATGSAGTNGLGGLTIASRYDGASAACCDISVKEIIVRSIIDDPENEAAIYNYLKSKNGL